MLSSSGFILFGSTAVASIALTRSKAHHIGPKVCTKGQGETSRAAPQASICKNKTDYECVIVGAGLRFVASSCKSFLNNRYLIFLHT